MVKKIYYYEDSVIAAWLLRKYETVGFKLYKPAEGAESERELSYSDLVGAAYNESMGLKPIIAPPYHIHPSCFPMVQLIIDTGHTFFNPIEGGCV